jgi:HPt (histidine-containing phosphotransfer) domain-containing protein
MTRDLFDTDQFMESLAQDRELAQELIDAFLEDCPRRVGELSEALEGEDVALATKLAHSLKGMCGVVRAGVLVRLALEMEYAGRNGNLDLMRDRFAAFSDKLERVEKLMARFLVDG